MDHQIFKLAEWQVRPGEGTIHRQGEVKRLEPKVMEVLVYLASRAGEVVTRDEFEQHVWRGAIVGNDAITATILKLRKAFEDNARPSGFITTIPKRGYQLNVVPEYNNKTPEEVQQGDVKQGRTRNNWRLVQAAVIVVLIFAVILILQRGPPSPDSQIPSILVMPLKNPDSVNFNDEFANSITEDIITDLSAISSLMVFASNTSFNLLDRKVSPTELHQELSVDYIVQGSLRRQGEKIRFNIELIDARTGLNKWAERYERNEKEIFQLRNQVIRNLVKVLAIKVTDDENSLLAKQATLNLQAYEYFIEGQTQSKIYTQNGNERARQAYRKALDEDHAYGRAYGAIAFTLAVDFLRGWTDKPVESLDRALAMAEKGVALGEFTPQTFWSLGYVHLIRKEFSQAESAAKEAIRISPNYADAYGLLALVNNSTNRPQRALDLVEKGIQLNPYYTWDYLYNKARAYYHLGQYDKAIPLLEQASERNENVIPIKLVLAASYIKAGRNDDAEWIVDQLLILNPATTVSHIEKSVPISDKKIKQEFIRDLRIAGLPED